MRRLVFRIGFTNDKLGTVQAVADPGTPERWWTGSIRLKEIISLAGLCLAFVQVHVSTSNHIAVLTAKNIAVREDINKLNRASKDLLPRSTYETDLHQQNARINDLAAGQRQIYGDLLQGGWRMRPCTEGK